MFDRIKRRSGTEQNGAREKNQSDRPRRKRPEDDLLSASADLRSPIDDDRDIATFDHLGQTLVGTLTVRTLSGPEAARLAQDLLENLRGPNGLARHVVLDLQNVEYMDSGCVGVLVELLTKLQNAGGRIALANTAHNVEYLFKLTRLDRLFPICRDVMKAIEAVERIG